MLNYKEYNFTQFENEGENCCRKIKVNTFKVAVQNLDCWFAAIRADEGATRKDIQPVENTDGLVKVNPLWNWTEKDVWRYIALNQIPVNPLYLEYRSLSCKFCSAKEEDENESERAGRWKGTNIKECGIHTQSLK